MADFYFLNGEIVSSDKANLHVSDLGILRGYGIFDFFRAIDGQPVFLEDHLDRLQNSAQLMGLNLSYGREEIKEAILEIVRLNPHTLLGVKVVVTGGYSTDGYTPAKQPNVIIFGKPFKFADAPNGLKLMTVEYIREIPEIKTTNYIVPIRVLQKQKEVQADDVLYYKDGVISESSRSNIFIIKKDKIITPKTGVLYGVTRKHVLQAIKNDFETEEREITTKEFFEADEVFMTASTKRITPVTVVDNHVFGNGKPGAITLKLMQRFLEYETNTISANIY
jgi:D-alanine transaminase/branched-chain amino acid aminotransferase